MKPVNVTKEELGAMFCTGGRNISKTKQNPPVVESNQSADNDSNQQSQATGLIHGKDGYGTHS